MQLDGSDGKEVVREIAVWLVVKLGKHCQLYAQVFADGQVHWRIERSKGSPLPLKKARKICKEQKGLWLESVEGVTEVT